MAGGKFGAMTFGAVQILVVGVGDVGLGLYTYFHVICSLLKLVMIVYEQHLHVGSTKPNQTLSFLARNLIAIIIHISNSIPLQQ